MDFIDLKAQQKRIREKLDARIKQVLDHGKYIMGPEISELEEKLSQYVGTKHCLSCSNGTDALLIPLMAWNIGAGDAVFVPSFTFVATAEIVSLAGATPIFVDVDARTFNIDPASLEKAIEDLAKKAPQLKPKAVIPVNLFGQMADYNAISRIAKKYNLFVLEDAAQSFGATWGDKKSCAFGDVGATSFFPAKPLGCYGDGGAIFCNDNGLHEIMGSIRIHGQGSDRYENVRIGMNGRLDTLQAAVLLEKLEIFNEELLLREKIATRYTEGLKKSYETPVINSEGRSAWAQYSLLCDNREKVLASLKAKGIPTMVYYPIPLHLQKAYQSSGYRKGDLPISERLAERIFSIPMHPYLSEEDQERIISALLEV